MTTQDKVAAQVERGIVGHEDDTDTLLQILYREYPHNMTDEQVTEFKRLAERWYFAVEPKPDWMTWDEFYLVIQN